MDKNDYMKRTGVLESNLLIDKWLIAIHAVLSLYFFWLKSYVLTAIALMGVVLNIVCAVRVQSKEDCRVFDKLSFYGLWFLLGVASCVLGASYGFHVVVIAFLVPVALCSDGDATDDVLRDNNLVKYLFNKREKVAVVIYTIFINLVVCIMDVYYLEPMKYQTEAYDVAANLAFVVNMLCAVAFIVYYAKIYTRFVDKNEGMLRQQADYDKLTGLYNRNRTRFILEHNYNSVKESDIKFGVAIMDIDDFKKINDTYGHNAGDYVLRRFADMVNDIVKKCEGQIVAGRWGGEEFLIIYYGDNKEDFYMLLDYIRMHINDANILYDRNTIKVSVTIGMTLYKEDIELNDLINEADKNLYAGKKSGKNKVVMEGMF